MKYGFRVSQGEQVVASGEGPVLASMTAEGFHYARVYSQDAFTRLEVFKVSRGKETIYVRAGLNRMGA